MTENELKMIYGLCKRAIRDELTAASQQFANAQEPLVEAIVQQRDDLMQLIAATRVVQETLKTLIDQLDAIYGGKPPGDDWWRGDGEPDAEP